MNKELYDIIEEVKGLEDSFKWIEAVMHLDKRICALEEGLLSATNLFEKITEILEGKNEISKIH